MWGSSLFIARIRRSSLEIASRTSRLSYPGPNETTPAIECYLLKGAEKGFFQRGKT